LLVGEPTSVRFGVDSDFEELLTREAAAEDKEREDLPAPRNPPAPLPSSVLALRWSVSSIR